jgi:hypothetical protein
MVVAALGASICVREGNDIPESIAGVFAHVLVRDT